MQQICLKQQRKTPRTANGNRWGHRLHKRYRREPPKLQRSVVQLLGKLGSQASTTGRRRIRIQALSTINGTLPFFGPGWLRKVDWSLILSLCKGSFSWPDKRIEMFDMHDDHDNYDIVHISYCAQGIIQLRRARLRPFSSRYCTVYRVESLPDR